MKKFTIDWRYQERVYVEAVEAERVIAELISLIDHSIESISDLVGMSEQTCVMSKAEADSEYILKRLNAIKEAI